MNGAVGDEVMEAPTVIVGTVERAKQYKIACTLRHF